MFKKLRDAKALWKALGQYEDIKKEIDTMDSKSLFMSKTFWLNILALATTIGGVLPEKYAVPVLTVANIVMRVITSQPVNVLPKS